MGQIYLKLGVTRGVATYERDYCTSNSNIEFI